jgi:hypothetical protein
MPGPRATPGCAREAIAAGAEAVKHLTAAGKQCPGQLTGPDVSFSARVTQSVTIEANSPGTCSQAK